MADRKSPLKPTSSRNSLSSPKKRKQVNAEMPIDLYSVDRMTADNAMVAHLQTQLTESKARLHAQGEVEKSLKLSQDELRQSQLAREKLQNLILDLNQQRTADAADNRKSQDAFIKDIKGLHD